LRIITPAPKWAIFRVFYSSTPHEHFGNFGLFLCQCTDIAARRGVGSTTTSLTTNQEELGQWLQTSYHPAPVDSALRARALALIDESRLETDMWRAETLRQTALLLWTAAHAARRAALHARLPRQRA
jgi:hypothetical protein